MDDEKTRIIDALDEDEYEISFIPNNSVEVCTRFDGRKFYKFHDKSEGKDVDTGHCIIKVAGHTFDYHIETDEWSGDDFADDDEVTDALECVDDFVDSYDYDLDMQWEVYAKAKNIDEDSDYFNFDDEDCPWTVEEVKNCDKEVEVSVYYAVKIPDDDDDVMELDCMVKVSELYALYRHFFKGVKINDEDDDYCEPVTLHGKDIKANFPDLYDRLRKCVADDMEDSFYDDVKFRSLSIEISKCDFDDCLGEKDF